MTRQLLVEGRPLAIGDRAFDLLCTLVERRDRAVSADELHRLVWPRVIVEPNNLHVQIWHLRHLLGRQAIVNRPRVGYRFVPHVDVDLIPLVRAIGEPGPRSIRRNSRASPDSADVERLDDLVDALEVHRYVTLQAHHADPCRPLVARTIDRMRTGMTGGVWSFTATDLGARAPAQLLAGAEDGWGSAGDLAERLIAAADDLLPVGRLGLRPYLLVYWRLPRGAHFDRPLLAQLARSTPGLHLLVVADSPVGDAREHVIRLAPPRSRTDPHRVRQRV